MNKYFVTVLSVFGEVMVENMHVTAMDDKEAKKLAIETISEVYEYPTKAFKASTITLPFRK